MTSTRPEARPRVDGTPGVSGNYRRMASQTDSRALIDPVVVLAAVVMAIYWSVIVTMQKPYSLEPWVTGDWLINYSDGFVRRGLVGEIIRRLYYTAGINPVSVVFAVKAILYGLISVGLAVLAARRRIDGFGLAFVISPPALAFEIYDSLGTGRKEIALLAAFITYVAIDTVAPPSRSPLHRSWQFWFLLIALPVLTLIHEGLFFFLPFFFIYLWVTHDGVATDLWRFAIPFVTAAAAFLLSYAFQGSKTTAVTVCSSVAAMSLDRALCGGAIQALGEYQVDIRGADVARFLFVAIAAFAPLVWYAARMLDVRHRRPFFVGVFLSTAATLPLYFVSEDWGRWIHITWMLTFGMILALKPVVVRPARRSRRATVLYVVATLIYVFSWRLPHWIHSPVPVMRWTSHATRTAGHLDLKPPTLQWNA